MEACQISLLLLLIAAASYGAPPESNLHVNGSHVPLEPRVQPPHPPPQPPLHGLADKHARPLDTDSSGAGSIPCSNDSNCTSSIMGEDSICHGVTCACNSLSTLSESSGRCLRESSLGSGCAEDWQCKKTSGNFVACKDHICTCTPDAAMVNKKCWQQKLLSAQCNADEECIKGHDSLCKDSRCACKVGLIPGPLNDKCLPQAKNFQDPCEDSIQCVEPFGDGSICSNGKCVCLDGYHFKNHECMKNLILGSQCGTGIDGDCFLVHGMGIDHVDCIAGKCTCKGDLIPSSDNQKCLSQGQTDPGSGGGADIVQPLLITFVTVFLARFFSS